MSITQTLPRQACTTCHTTTLQLRPPSQIMVDKQLSIPKTRLCHMPIHVAMSQNTDTHQHAHNKNVAEHTRTRNNTDPNTTKHAKLTTFDYARNGPCKTQPPLNPSEHVPGDLGPVGMNAIAPEYDKFSITRDSYAISLTICIVND